MNISKFIKYLVILMTLTNLIFSQTGFENIDKEIVAGNYTNAKKLIAENITNNDIIGLDKYKLNMQSEILDRVVIDFKHDKNYIKEKLSKYYPDLSDTQLQRWETSGELEMRMIDGEKKYFRNAVPNLFRVNKKAKNRKIELDGEKEDELDIFLKDYLPPVVKDIKSSGKNIVKQQNMELIYTITVDTNVVPVGEVIRAWLPYPRDDIERQGNVKFISANNDSYFIASDDFLHKSIYMEKFAIKDEPTIFEYKVSYTGFNEWYDVDNLKIKLYDKNSDLYRKYTSERNTHIIFTSEIRELSNRIIGGEKDPRKIVRLAYEWIGKNIPWTSALEYSTIPNIPSYSINNKKGDCGIKSLLFITLCRYNGIPAKWQSGWMLHPGSKNLHDWSEVYFEGVGWIPVDTSFNNTNIIKNNKNAKEFFLSGIDAYHMVVNQDYSGDFFPAKIFPRSETVDFQRGEVEWKGGNLYFNTWDYHMEVNYLD
jgi:transglutaminase-like putative cysteine protease